MAASTRPRPTITDENRFYFDGAAAGELRIQCCDGCGALRFPPGPMCPRCNALEWSWRVAAGHGVVHSWTVHHHPPIDGLPSPCPIVLVELDEGVRVVGNLVDGDAAPEIGAEVEVVFVADEGDDLVLPQWRSVRR